MLRSEMSSPIDCPERALAHTYAQKLALFIVAVMAVRTLARELLGLELHFDEAQYVVWSFTPSWGYFSKPPLIAWTIGAARWACGDGDACIRLPSAIAFSLAAWFVFLTARRLFNEATAFWAAVIFLLSPIVGLLSWFMTTDSLLVLSWSAAVYTLLRALQAANGSERLLWWIATGAMTGLGMLSKYSMGVFGASVFGLLVASQRLRPQFRAAGPWLCTLTALTLVVPNIVWNAGNDFSTVRHTAEISHIDRAAPDILRGLEFLVAQLGAFGPIAFCAFGLGLAGIKAAIEPDARGVSGHWRGTPGFPAWPFLAWLSVPFIVLIAAQAVAARAHANWAAPAYVTASIAAAAWLSSRPSPRLLTATLTFNALVMLALFTYRPVLATAGVYLKVDPANQLVGWRGLADEVRLRLESSPPTTRLMFDERRLMSRLIAYTGPAANDALIWNPEGAITNHYHLTRDARRAPSGPFLFVSDRDRTAELSQAFESVSQLHAIVSATAGGSVTRSVYAWRLGSYIASTPDDAGKSIQPRVPK